MAITIEKTYKPVGPTAVAFHKDDSFVRLLIGGVGLGKTSACTVEILAKALSQAPDLGGVRRSRWLIVRNSEPQLRLTNIKTFLEWIPEEVSNMRYGSPITSRVKIDDVGDGTALDMEVIFYPLDRPEDMHKIRGLELTGAYLSEVSELPKEILDICTQRVGRYPPNSPSSPGPTWSGVVAESNPPDDDSWIYDMFEVIKPKSYKRFHYPPSVRFNDTSNEWEGHPDAEGVHLYKNGYNYWLNQIPGKTKEWIKVYLCGEYGPSVKGKPVFLDVFDPAAHVAPKDVKPDTNIPVLVGFDWGLTPAAVFCQLSHRGTLHVLDEITPVDTSLDEFIEEYIRPLVVANYRGCRLEGVGDPAGRGRSPLDKATPFQIINQVMRCVPAPTNVISTRIDSIKHFLLRRNGLLINPRCQMVRKGLHVGYVYEETRSGQTKPKPLKNEYSHPIDALSYVATHLKIAGRRAEVATTQAAAGAAW